MNNTQFLKNAKKYKALSNQIKVLDKERKKLSKDMGEDLIQEGLEEFSYKGASAIVINTVRQSYAKEKLLAKFGEAKLADCMNITEIKSVRVNFKEE